MILPCLGFKRLKWKCTCIRHILMKLWYHLLDMEGGGAWGLQKASDMLCLIVGEQSRSRYICEPAVPQRFRVERCSHVTGNNYEIGTDHFEET